MDRAEERLKNRVATKMYADLMAKGAGATPSKDIAALAWQLADEFMKAREENKRDQYARVLGACRT